MMGKEPVYRFTIYDITTDEDRLSHRMGTRAAIERVNGTIVAGSEHEIDEAELGRDVAGMTDRDFWTRINAIPGFQQQVTR